jgi:hypothetical protein
MRITDDGRRYMVIIAASALAFASCDGRMIHDVNKPLAQAELSAPPDFKRVNQIVAEFSRKNHFAVQPLINQPQGAVDFSMRLFRDDISVTIARVHGESLQVAAFPLCACELDRRIGLQTAADATVNDLRRELSRQ